MAPLRKDRGSEGQPSITCDDLDDAGLWTTLACCPACHEDAGVGVRRWLPINQDYRLAELCCTAISTVLQGADHGD